MNLLDLELVFVRLGPRRNSYLNSNIIRLRKLFPDLSISVIEDEVSRRKSKQLPGVNYHLYVNQNARNFNNAKSHKSKLFREGFWNLTSERLFAVLDYKTSNPGKSVLHIESDVLLFPNFPFADFVELKLISWCCFNESKDVASLFYLPANSDVSWLKSELQNEFVQNSEATDMTALSNISRQNMDKVRIFPSLSSLSISQLANPRNLNVLNNLDRLMQLESHFSGIFDPAAIGMWLCGMDPENHHGKLLLHDKTMLENGDSFINPSALSYKLDSGGNLYFMNNESWIPIYNLHVHSKNRKILSVCWIPELKKYIEMALTPEPITRKNLGIFCSVLVQQGSPKGALRYMSGHPIVYPLAKLIGTLVRKPAGR
jgi:hypothetical protein